MKIQISRNVLLAMNIFVSRDECRYPLNGIGIEVTKKGQCYLIATDGRRIAAINTGTVLEAPAAKRSAILPINPAMLKSLPRQQTDTVILTVNETTAIFAESIKKNAVSFETPLIEGSFPKWRKVIPTGKQKQPISPTFNWELLDGFGKAAAMLCKSGSGISVHQADELSPMLILIPSCPSFVGALMPMRTYNEDASAPDWATTEEVEPETKEAAPTQLPNQTAAPAAV